MSGEIATVGQFIKRRAFVGKRDRVSRTSLCTASVVVSNVGHMVPSKSQTKKVHSICYVRLEC